MAWKFRLLSAMCGFSFLLVCYCCYYEVPFLTNYVLLCASSKFVWLPTKISFFLGNEVSHLLGKWM
jgi:hypothetical protein